MKKRTKTKLIIASMLLLTLFLTGCGLFKSDTQKLTELLEDKYGEEFGVESYYYAGDMWAMCYPVSDPTLLFEVRTDGEVTFIGHDYYLQTVVQRQVDEELQPLVEQAFPGSFVSSRLSASDYEGQTADKVTLASMLEYNNSSSTDDDPTWTYITLRIFVDTTQMTDENIETEYAFFVEEISGRVKRGELPDTIVVLYFGDEVFINDCETIIANEQWYAYSTIYEKIKGCPYIRFYLYEQTDLLNGPIEYDGMEYTIENYITERMEIINNE